jgi:hypothetical protein
MKFNVTAIIRYGLVFGIVIGVGLLFSLTLLSGKVTEVFSSIDDGLMIEEHSTGLSIGADSAPINVSYTSSDAMALLDAEGARNAQIVQRMVIKNASITIKVDDVTVTETAINKRVSELQGFVVESATHNMDNNRFTDMTVRVPVDMFETMLATVQDMAINITSLSVSGEDVTAEFVDLDSQQRNLEATRDRLKAILDTAGNVPDALNANDALSRVQSEIEVMQGRKQYLQQNAAMSTVTISIYKYIEPFTIKEVEEHWRPMTTASESWKLLVTFSLSVANVIIAVAVWFPVWVPLMVFGIWFYRKKSRKQHTS